MHNYLPFVAIGLASGAIYGLFATGLVLTYKTSGIFNFAQGAIATVAAYMFYFLHVDHGMAWLPAVVIAVGVLGPVIGTAMEPFAARLSIQPTALKIAGPIGVVLFVEALATIKYGSQTLRVAPFIPHAKDTFRLFGVVISYDKVIVAAVSLVAVVALSVLFRFTRLGIALRAVVDDPRLVSMQATNPAGIRRIAWIIGSTFAALSGVLYTSFIGVDSVALTFLVVQAVGAAAIGYFDSLPLTFAGALFLGVAAALSEKYVLNVTWLSGLPDALPFVVLFAVLLLTPRGKLVSPSTESARPALPYRAPTRVRLAAAFIVLIPLLLMPEIVGTRLPYFTTGLCTALMLLSLGLLVRTSGQVSLCHAAFAAVGAVAFSQLRVEHGVAWVPALLLAGLIAVPVGAIVAVPAIRLSGLFLALATLAFGFLVQKLIYNESWMFTNLAQGRVMPLPSAADTTQRFYYVVLAAVVIASVMVALIERARLGRMLRGMSGSPRAVMAMGLSTNVTKLIVFCIAAYLAAIAGALLGVTRGFAVADDSFYQPFFSLVLVAMLAVAPFGEPWYALVPAASAVIPGYLSGSHTTDWLTALFGVGAVLIAMKGGQPAMPSWSRSVLDRFGGRRDATARLQAIETQRSPPHAAGLSVQDLAVRFGGLHAVDGITLSAPGGRITGLIGPNGAGKTTAFDAISGLNKNYAGAVYLDGAPIDRASPADRARRGIGRTFQRMELAEALSVLDNVRLGREASQTGRRPLAHFAAPRRERATAEASAWSALEICGIASLAGVQAGALSTPERRLVELARCLAGPFGVLLLDEPSSGLDRDETARFGDVLQHVVAERGVGILLVEHDVELVTRVCDHVYVLNFGKVICDGTAEEVAASDLVRAAYLGSDDPVDASETRVHVSDPAASPPPHSGVALEVAGLSAGYGDTIVLRDISLAVPAGSAVALLGANGAGKTTFLNAVSGFVRARCGTIRIGDDDVTTMKPHERFELGMCYVPEGRGIFRGLTVRENLFLQSRRGQEQEAVERAVAAFPVLGQRLQQRAGSLSGGEQQMLAVAAAYVRAPSLMLVDEASLGLAPIIVDEIFEFLEQRTACGSSVLIVDQFVGRALGMTSRAYVVQRGSVVFEGSSSEMLSGDLYQHYLGRVDGG